MSKLNQLIHRARIKRGLTQEEFAHRLGGYTAQYVSGWERNVAPVPHARLPGIAKILEIPTNKLINAAVDDFRSDILFKWGS